MGGVMQKHWISTRSKGGSRRVRGPRLLRGDQWRRHNLLTKRVTLRAVPDVVQSSTQ